VKRFGLVLGAGFVLLGVFGAGFEGSHGLAAFWEHWWCPTPLVVIALGAASMITAHRLGPSA
jgi:hypothetical protein